MKHINELFNWLDTQKDTMVEMAVQWANINSHTLNHSGVLKMTECVESAFKVFNATIEKHPMIPFQRMNAHGEFEEFPIAPIITVTQRPEADNQILFVCHIDTVYPVDSDFQTCIKLNENTINGPGITDAKGGIIVMLKVLEAIENSDLVDHIGWKVIINTDEEIGSPSSGAYLCSEAKQFDLGLVFEPSLPNGDLVSERKGSGNFTFVVKGKQAHAGRNPDEGRNAIVALAAWIGEVKKVYPNDDNVTVNMGELNGGTAANVVADFAMVHFNVRYINKEFQSSFQESIERINQNISEGYDVKVSLHGKFSAPPKPMDEKTETIFNRLKASASNLNMNIDWKASGGVCDGNRLADSGLTTVDTLGVQGGDIHSLHEYVLVDSFVQRAKMVTQFIYDWVKN